MQHAGGTHQVIVRRYEYAQQVRFPVQAGREGRGLSTQRTAHSTAAACHHALGAVTHWSSLPAIALPLGAKREEGANLPHARSHCVDFLN